ncbi:MAG TPA: ABC transporter permease, partial [Terriglobia bacterium]|nr:ABC transporter permease [Terriglobia bacterium]
MSTLVQDVKYGLRMLAKNRGFAVVAVLTLALGIGANTAIFSVVNAVLLRALPYKDADRLVMIWETEPSGPGGLFPDTGPDFRDWVAQNHVFESMAAATVDGATLTGAGEPIVLHGVNVYPGMFKVLGVEPLRGRTFAADEIQTGRDHVVVLSYGLWEHAFGLDPGIVGRKITLNGAPYDVIGVMPRDLQFPEIWGQKPDYWAPINFEQPDWKKSRGNHWLWVLARLKPGVTVEQAGAEMETLSRQLEKQYPDSNAGVIAKVRALREQLTMRVKPALLVLLAAVGFLLLIACVNVVNLLLTRAVSREREVAVRLAVGSSRWRLIRQLLTESVLLFFMGGIAGLALGSAGVRLLLRAAPAGYIPSMMHVKLDAAVFAFTFLIAFVTGAAGGLVPALQASRLDLNETLKESGRSTTSPRHRSRSVLTAGEIALALVMLIGSGLAIRSLVRLLGVQAGFDPGQVLTFRLGLPQFAYP